MLGENEFLEVLKAAQQSKKIVITAPAGSGKSTWLLWRMVGREFSPMFAFQIRRSITKLLAHYVAGVVGEPVGEAVGYMVRHDHRPGTRLTYATDGELPAVLQLYPGLRGVGAIVVDDFHERRVWQDVAVAIVAYWQDRGADVPLIVMSATLEAEALSRRYPDAVWLDFGAGSLGEAPDGRMVVTLSGARVEVRHVYDSRAEDRGRSSLHCIPEAVRMAVSMMDEGRLRRGDILIFLPGMREIQEWADWARREMPGWEVVRAHSMVSHEEIQRAFRNDGTPKIILATNMFEVAVTLPSVSAVVDSGLERLDVHEGTVGIVTLRTEWISRQSALQRAGRAGRVGRDEKRSLDGFVACLYSPAQLRKMRLSREPEIRRRDVSDVVLFLRAHGVDVEEIVRFLPDPPDDKSIQSASRRLRRMGALDETGRLTELGRRMAAIPVDVLLAYMIARATREGRPDVLAPMLMGLSVFFVTEGRLRFPDERRDKSAPHPSSMRVTVSRWAVEFGTEVAAYAMLLRLYLHLRGAEELPIAKNPRLGWLLALPPDLLGRFWRDNRMEEARLTYRQVLSILRRSGVEVPPWDGGDGPLPGVRRLLVMAMADRMYRVDSESSSQRHSCEPLGWERGWSETVRMDSAGAFPTLGELPQLVIPLGETRVEGKRGEVVILTGVTEVRLPDDLSILPEGMAKEDAQSPKYDPSSTKVKQQVYVSINGRFAGDYHRFLLPGREAGLVFADRLLSTYWLDGPPELAEWRARLRSELSRIAKLLEPFPEMRPILSDLQERAREALAGLLSGISSLKEFHGTENDIRLVVERTFGEKGMALLAEISRIRPDSVRWAGLEFPVEYGPGKMIVRIPPEQAAALPPEAYEAFRKTSNQSLSVLVRLEGVNSDSVPADWESVQCVLATVLEGRPLQSVEDFMSAPLLEPVRRTGADGRPKTVGYWGLQHGRDWDVWLRSVFPRLEDAQASIVEHLPSVLADVLAKHRVSGEPEEHLRRLFSRWLRVRTSGWGVQDFLRLRERDELDRLLAEARGLEEQYARAVSEIRDVEAQVSRYLREIGVPSHLLGAVSSIQEDADYALEMPWVHAMEMADSIQSRWLEIRRRLEGK